MERKAFYDSLRGNLYPNGFGASTVKNMEVILDYIEQYDLPIDHAAYVLATAYHEVGAGLNPVRENLNYTSAQAIKKTWPSRFPNLAAAEPFVKSPQALANKVYNGRMGNIRPNDGWLYRGGGYPQLTGFEMYKKFGTLLGLPLANNPDIILQPNVAGTVMVLGMTKGLFTGAKLADFQMPGGGYDFVAARSIINADVKRNGPTIAAYARAFLAALREADYGEKTPAPVKPIPVPKPVPQPVPVPERGVQLWVLGGIGAAIAAAAAWFTLG